MDPIKKNLTKKPPLSSGGTSALLGLLAVILLAGVFVLTRVKREASDRVTAVHDLTTQVDELQPRIAALKAQQEKWAKG